MSDYENENEDYSTFFSVMSAIFAFIGVNYLLGLTSLPMWATGIINLCVYVFLLFMSVKVVRLRDKRKDRLVKKILEELKYNGFMCRMEEGHIRITRHERDWNVYVIETNHPRIWDIVFSYPFTMDNPEAVSWVGYDVLAAEASSYYPIKVMCNNSQFACTYRCAIGNTSDFMLEYDRAWRIIGESVEWMSSQWETTKQYFPAHRTNENRGRTVGFKRGDNTLPVV